MPLSLPAWSIGIIVASRIRTSHSVLGLSCMTRRGTSPTTETRRNSESSQRPLSNWRTKHACQRKASSDPARPIKSFAISSAVSNWYSHTGRARRKPRIVPEAPGVRATRVSGSIAAILMALPHILSKGRWRGRPASVTVGRPQSTNQGLTVRLAVLTTPPADAWIFSVVFAVTVLVTTVNVAAVLPDGIVALAGKVAIAAPLVVTFNATDRSVDGA